MIHKLLRLFRPAVRRLSRTILRVTELDDRVLPSTTVVWNTGVFPYSTAVKLYMTWDVNHNGRVDGPDRTYVGSGTMIGRYKVLTAAHCLCDTDPNTPVSGFANWVQVIPGMRGTYRPFGSAWASRIFVPLSWTRGAWTSDIGVIVLNTPLGNRTGWLTYNALSSTYLRAGLTVNMTHYPADAAWRFDGRYAYYSYGPITSADSQTFSYSASTIFTVGGSSGGGVYVRNLNIPGYANNRVIVGVHVRGISGVSGLAIRLTPTWVQLIWNAGVTQAAPTNSALQTVGVPLFSGGRQILDVPSGPAVGIVAPPEGYVLQSAPPASPANRAPWPALGANVARAADELPVVLTRPAALTPRKLDLSEDQTSDSVLHGTLVGDRTNMSELDSTRLVRL